MGLDIEWEEPPPIRRSAARLGRTRLFVEALKGRPGQWAKYPHRFTSSSATYVYKVNYPDVEWTARKADDGMSDVYARWIGDA